MAAFVLVAALALLMFLTAIAGSVVPILPGPLLAFLAVLLLKLTIASDALSWACVLVCLLITAASFALDYVLPVKYTPTRAGSWGAFAGVFAGLVVGMLFPPLAVPAIFLAPLLLAFAFEYRSNASFKKAWQSGKGAFFGTLMSVFARVAAIFLMVLALLADFVI